MIRTVTDYTLTGFTPAKVRLVAALVRRAGAAGTVHV